MTPVEIYAASVAAVVVLAASVVMQGAAKVFAIAVPAIGLGYWLARTGGTP